MERTTRARAQPRGWRILLLLVAAIGSLAACGSGNLGPASPALPSSLSPSAAPPSAFAYVFDPHAGALLAYTADAATGALRFVESQDLGYPRCLAADPLGRFVYAAATDSGESFVRSYAVEPATGRLTWRDEQPLNARALSMAATETRVHVIGAARTTGYIGYWSMYDVDAATGRIEWTGPGPWRRDPFFVAIEPSGEVLYTVAHESPGLGWTELLYASSTREDGSVVDRDSIKLQTETSDVVLGAAILFTADRAGRVSSRTLVGAGQIRLLARLEHAFEGGTARLALGRPTMPRLSATSPTPGTLLAVSSSSGLRTYTVGATGELTPAGTAALPLAEDARVIAFHPFGRHLYASSPGEGVRVFRVQEDGQLQETAREPRGGGAIVLTAPPG
jgi:6-phosphogluconolactonase (cycloisomerase 2 family)